MITLCLFKLCQISGVGVYNSIIGSALYSVTTYPALTWALFSALFSESSNEELCETYTTTSSLVNLLDNELPDVKIISQEKNHKVIFQGTDEELAKLQHTMLKNQFYVFDSWLWSTKDNKSTLTVTYHEKYDM